MSPAELRAGEATFLRIRNAVPGSAEHRDACETFDGWAMENAEDLLRMAREALERSPVTDDLGPTPTFPPQNLGAPKARKVAPAAQAEAPRYPPEVERVLARHPLPGPVAGPVAPPVDTP